MSQESFRPDNFKTQEVIPTKMWPKKRPLVNRIWEKIKSAVQYLDQVWMKRDVLLDIKHTWNVREELASVAKSLLDMWLLHPQEIQKMLFKYLDKQLDKLVVKMTEIFYLSEQGSETAVRWDDFVGDERQVILYGLQSERLNKQLVEGFFRENAIFIDDMLGQEPQSDFFQYFYAKCMLSLLK